METIKGLTTSTFSSHNLQQKCEKENNDKLKETILKQNESLQHLMFTYNKLNKKVSSDIYEVNCRAVVKNIQDFNPPVCVLTIGAG